MGCLLSSWLPADYGQKFAVARRNINACAPVHLRGCVLHRVPSVFACPPAACPVPQVLQRMLGERYMYHKKTGKGDDPSNYHPYYIDMSERVCYGVQLHIQHCLAQQQRCGSP